MLSIEIDSKFFCNSKLTSLTLETTGLMAGFVLINLYIKLILKKKDYRVFRLQSKEHKAFLPNGREGFFCQYEILLLQKSCLIQL